MRVTRLMVDGSGSIMRRRVFIVLIFFCGC
jgi:hypothetical protein